MLALDWSAWESRCEEEDVPLPAWEEYIRCVTVAARDYDVESLFQHFVDSYIDEFWELEDLLKYITTHDESYDFYVPSGMDSFYLFREV